MSRYNQLVYTSIHIDGGVNSIFDKVVTFPEGVRWRNISVGAGGQGW